MAMGQDLRAGLKTPSFPKPFMSLRFSSTHLEISPRERRTSPAEPGPPEEGGREVGADEEANDVSGGLDSQEECSMIRFVRQISRI